MKSLLAPVIGVCLFTGAMSVSAAPPNLFDLTGVPGSEIYTDTGFSAASLIDTDSVDDDATAWLFLEAGPFINSNNFGIYGFEMTDAGVIMGERLEIFAGELTPGGFFPTSATLSFDLDENTVTNTVTGESAEIGKYFGFYLETPQAGGQIYYSHASLNSDGVDHMLLFDTHDNSIGAFGGADIVLAWEDALGGGEGGFSNALIGITDVRPLPEPHSIALVIGGVLITCRLGKRSVSYS